MRLTKSFFELPGGKGKGTCIWEPLSTWEKVFDNNGKTNDLVKLYDEISKKYMVEKKIIIPCQKQEPPHLTNEAVLYCVSKVKGYSYCFKKHRTGQLVGRLNSE